MMHHHRCSSYSSSFYYFLFLAVTMMMSSTSVSSRRGGGAGWVVGAWIFPARSNTASFQRRLDDELSATRPFHRRSATSSSSPSIATPTTLLPRRKQPPSHRHQLLTFRLAASGKSSTGATTTLGGGTTASSTSNKDENDHGITLEDIASLSTATAANFGGLEYRKHSTSKFRVVFVLGGPGAGKGTQSALLEENYPCVHLSAGHLLRDAAEDENSEHAETIQKALVAGSIVPVEISLSLLRRAMSQTKGREWIFLIDGFPRNYDNLRGWCEYMPESSDLCKVLVYTCPFDVLQERIMARSKVESRTDDTLETLQRRFRTFETESMPVVDMLMNDDKKVDYVAQINGNDNVDTVWERTREVVNAIVVDDVLTENAALLEAVRQNDVAAYRKLCDPGWFNEEDASDREVMSKQEGSSNSFEEKDDIGDCIKDAEVEVVTGRQVAVSYTRNFDNDDVREKRIWSHKGDGWRNVHFSRTPV